MFVVFFSHDIRNFIFHKPITMDLGSCKLKSTKKHENF